MNKQLLHVGCGKNTKQGLKGFENWSELRFDIDPKVNPDIIGSVVDLNGIEDASVDAVFSQHNIEHLYPHEVVPSLTNFARVLKADGFAIINCPDLQSVCEAILKNGLLETVYTSPAGDIAPIDILYGHRASLFNNPHMAHKCGFTAPVLAGCLNDAGFSYIYGGRHSYDLWLMAFKHPPSAERVQQLAVDHLP